MSLSSHNHQTKGSLQFFSTVKSKKKMLMTWYEPWSFGALPTVPHNHCHDDFLLYWLLIIVHSIVLPSSRSCRNKYQLTLNTSIPYLRLSALSSQSISQSTVPCPIHTIVSPSDGKTFKMIANTSFTSIHTSISLLRSLSFCSVKQR